MNTSTSSEDTQRSVTIERYEGGFVVYMPEKTVVTTSLQKAMQYTKSVFSCDETKVISPED